MQIQFDLIPFSVFSLAHDSDVKASSKRMQMVAIAMHMTTSTSPIFHGKKATKVSEELKRATIPSSFTESIH